MCLPTRTTLAMNISICGRARTFWSMRRRTGSWTWHRPILAARRPCTRSTLSGRFPIANRIPIRSCSIGTGRTIGRWSSSPSLTPVWKPEEGAHYYVETSHDVKMFERSLNARGVAGADIESLSGRIGEVIAPVAMRLFEHSARRFDGPAGQSFCGDGYGLHRAVVPRSRPRLLLWFRFGNFYNETMYSYRCAAPPAPRPAGSPAHSGHAASSLRLQVHGRRSLGRLSDRATVQSSAEKPSIM